MKDHLLPKNQNVFPFRLLKYSSTQAFQTKKLLCFFVLFITALVFGQVNDNTPGKDKTFTVPANVTHVNAAAWGGGGGGGGSDSNNNGGNGGGGGGAASSQIAVAAGNVFTYTVGTGGAGGAANNGTGGNGGTSSITSAAPATSLTGNGGTGGRGNAVDLNIPTNSGGGAATGGTTSPGSNGVKGGNSGGNGGNSGVAFGIFGTGGAGNTNTAGSPGESPGAGGGGGERDGIIFGTNRAGGAGAPGRVMIDFITVTSVAPATACAGSTITITGTNFSASGTTTVSVNGVACTSVTVVNDTTITAVLAASATSGVVNIVNDGRRNNGRSITVTASPAVPGNPTSNSPQCAPNPVTLTRTGTPPAGVTWYWQTAAGNTDMTNSAATYSVTTSGTYYIRARNNTTGCWSAGAGSVTVIVNSPVSAIATNPAPANNATGVCYRGIGEVSSISWSAVANATSYDVYFGAGSLPGTLTANVATTSYNTGTLAANTTYFWRIVPRSSCGITTGSPVTWRFTTAARSCLPTYCTPTTTTAANTYITDVEFRGTLNDVKNNNNGYSGGYQDFTNLASNVSQAAGEGINIFVKSNDVDTSWKAWVDWNRDGTFNNSTEVIFSSSTLAISTSFGFVIPAGTAPGDYVVRIRNYRRSCAQPSGFCGSTSYNSCEAFTGTTYGEAEDYVITVTANCAAVINSVAMQSPAMDYCGASAVPLVAKASAGTTKIRWYNAESGGTLLAEMDPVLVSGELQAIFTTPVITTSTTYWVTAFNGSCETIYRKPVTAKIKPIPALSFNLPPDNANFCGDNDRLILTSSGNEELVTLIDEDFESGNLGVFGVSNGAINNSTVSQTQWQNQPSPFKPVGAIWSPVISSGFAPNRFAFATSDYSTRTVETILTSTNNYNTSSFTNLTLTFSAYYSFYGDTSASAGGVVEGFFVEVSTDNGANWTTVRTYDALNPGPDGTPSLGYGTRFRNLSINLDSYRNLPSVKIRFRYRAYWGDGLAIDNIKLFGNRPLSNSFVWTAPNIGVFQQDCTTPYINGTTTTSICIRPTAAQLEAIADWNISAQQTVSNGCTTTASIAIHNLNKIWNTTSSTNWGATNRWLPTNEIPDIGKCVIIKRPVNILTGAHFEARSVKVESTGSLTIQNNSSLKIQDALVNQAAATSVLLESGANLLQVNEGVNINSGNITARKDIVIYPGRRQYNYLISPLEGQGLKTIYPGIDFVLRYNEHNNFFSNSDGSYIKGRGLAVKEPNATAVPSGSSVTATFTGRATNGAFTYNIVNTNPAVITPGVTMRGYNLVGNPYPSNIDMVQFYAINGGSGGTIDATFNFWDPSVNRIYEQMGSNYPGQSYGQFNAQSGIGTPANGDIGSASLFVPTRYVKSGKSFIVRSIAASTNLVFNNTIRTHLAAPPNSRFGEGAASDSYWLSMISPNNIASTIAVTYFEGGDDSLAADDSFSLMGGDALYSIVGNENLSINGKSPFTVTDKIDLGTAHFAAGTYTMTLFNKEGIFATGQKIYLKDKQTGILTELTAGNYSFTAPQGIQTGRFEIVYEPEIVLVTDGSSKANLVVYRDRDDFVIRAPQKMAKVQVFDASGRLLLQLSPAAAEARIDAERLVHGIFVLKIELSDGAVLTKKIRK